MVSAVITLFIITVFQPQATDTLTLEYAQQRIEKQYPLAKKLELQDEITTLNRKIVSTTAYPQLNVEATASYQSEVTEFELPSAGGQFEGPTLSQDQYNIRAEILLPIYNSGAVGIRQDIEQIKGEQEQLSTKVELHRLKEQLNQTYFSVLLAEQQREIIETLLGSLRDQLATVKSRVENGILLPSQQHILEAEITTTLQDSAEIASNIRSGYMILSQLIGEVVSPHTALKLPHSQFVGTEKNAELRPEFKLFEANRQTVDLQKELTETNKVPSVSAFGTAAYGRPGYNVFEDELHPYYMVGLRMQWNFWDSYNSSVQQQVHNLQKKSIDEEERAFGRQLKARLSKIETQIEAFKEQIRMDREIVQLREKVVAEKSSQLENGTATATEYVTELQKQTQARLSMQMHRIQLEQAKVDYQTVLGEKIIN